MTMKMGIVAEMIVPADADVPCTPKDWATLPSVMPITPSAMMLGTARQGTRSRPAARTMNNGTATRKRMAVSVRGGIASSPSFVIGIDRPHMIASSSIAPRLRAEMARAGTAAGARTAASAAFWVMASFDAVGRCVHLCHVYRP